jgi:glucosamine 6-phosphate synthetase-like amidotransferase/phosphosugar isomerase protein
MGKSAEGRACASGRKGRKPRKRGTMQDEMIAQNEAEAKQAAEAYGQEQRQMLRMFEMEQRLYSGDSQIAVATGTAYGDALAYAEKMGNCLAYTFRTLKRRSERKIARKVVREMIAEIEKSVWICVLEEEEIDDNEA